MAHIEIQKIHSNAVQAASCSVQAQALADQIRSLAFALFEKRGSAHGHALEDWLAAERQLVLEPVAQWSASDGQCQLRLAASGFAAPDLHVTAWSTSLEVLAPATHPDAIPAADPSCSESSGKTLFLRQSWPESIDVDTVQADLADGILQVTATRRDRAEEQGRS